MLSILSHDISGLTQCDLKHNSICSSLKQVVWSLLRSVLLLHNVEKLLHTRMENQTSVCNLYLEGKKKHHGSSFQAICLSILESIVW